jgi:hypothetical protein
MSETSKEGNGSKWAVLPMFMMMIGKVGDLEDDVRLSGSESILQLFALILHSRLQYYDIRVHVIGLCLHQYLVFVTFSLSLMRLNQLL